MAAISGKTATGYGHVFRIRLDGEGFSAADVEHTFSVWTEAIEKAIGVPMHNVGQVIEQTKADSLPDDGGNFVHRAAWFKGRCNLAPDLTVQGYDDRESFLARDANPQVD